MTKEKKIRLRYTVAVTVEGYGDKKYFKKVGDKAMKNLHYNTTSSHISDGSCVLKIAESKVINSEEVV